MGWTSAVASLLLLALAAWTAFPGQAALQREGEEFARDHLAYVDAEFVPALDRAHLADRRGASVVLALAALALVPLDRLSEWSDVKVTLYPLVGLLFAGFAGWRLHIAGTEFPAPGGRPLVARVRRIEVDDYVAPWARAASRGAVLASLVAGAAVVSDWFWGAGSVGVAVLAVAGAVALVVAVGYVDVVARALCDRPQSSVDGCHLYFQDAWRASFLQRAYFAMVFGAAGYLAGLAATYEPGLLEGSLMLVVGVVLANRYLVRDDARLRFRARLWPTLPAGTVLMPGQQAPDRAGVPT